MGPRDLRLALRLRRGGVVYPVATIKAARSAGLPLPLACAILEQESGGGHNEFGHDPSIFRGAGHVTRRKYLAYKAQRGRTRMQGVGPCQLTWWSFQDEADALGGCWKPRWNMQVGFKHLAELVRRSGLRAGVAAYNGSGPAAQEYATEVLTRVLRWQTLLAPKPY